MDSYVEWTEERRRRSPSASMEELAATRAVETFFFFFFPPSTHSRFQNHESLSLSLSRGISGAASDSSRGGCVSRGRQGRTERDPVLHCKALVYRQIQSSLPSLTSLYSTRKYTRIDTYLDLHETSSCTHTYLRTYIHIRTLGQLHT